MIWYDMPIWYDTIRYDTIRYDIIWYDQWDMICNMISNLALSIMVPFIRFIHIFLFAKTILCILVSIEFTKNVSGNQNFSHAAPPRIIVLLMPKANRGSCQNCPRYKSTSKSWKFKNALISVFMLLLYSNVNKMIAIDVPIVTGHLLTIA